MCEIFTEAVATRRSVKKVFLEISQNSQENTLACNFVKKEALAQVFSCEFCEISKNTFSYRTPPVAVSVFNNTYFEDQKWTTASVTYHNFLLHIFASVLD